MAERAGAASAAGLEITQCNSHKTYTGTKAQLVAAGIVPAGVAFPGERDPKIYKTRPYQFTTADGQIRNIRRHGASRFYVSVPLTPDERAAARAKEELASKAKAAKRELQILTKRTAEDWRNQLADCVVGMTGAALSQAGGCEVHGFYFRQADIDAIQASIKRLGEQIRSASVYCCKERHEARRRELLAACAADDSALQGFLLRAQAQAGQAS